MTGVLRKLSRAQQPLSLAVFRALNLGDLLCFMPALRALRQAFPKAHIALVGLESARPLLQRFPHYLDELILFPGDEQFPEQPVDYESLPLFYARMQERHFDLALQMHGSGQRSNDIVMQLGAREWAGFVPSIGQTQTGRFMVWPDRLPEVLRYLALLDHLGLPVGQGPAATDMELALLDADHDEAAALTELNDLDFSRTVIVHAGARLPSRRWPVARFAQVARELSDEGWHIVLTGSQDESGLVDEMQNRVGRPVVNLCGQTSLGAMAVLLKQAQLLICNDTGVSHIAAAMKTPSVVIACGSDVARWAPLDRALHTVLHADLPCRPCAWHECPFSHHPCATEISIDSVLKEARLKLAPESLTEATGMVAASASI